MPGDLEFGALETNHKKTFGGAGDFGSFAGKVVLSHQPEGLKALLLAR